MGSSASKAARKLPTNTASAPRPAPSWAGARTPHPEPLHPEGTSAAQPKRALPSHLNTAPPEAEASAGGAVYSKADRARNIGAGGAARPGFSGEKDDALMRDAMDPQFASNLSRLGQVKINDAGKFYNAPAQAQRTLNARTEEFTSTSAAPPTNHLTATLLISLLDRLKALPAGSDPSKVYKEYKMEPATMEKLRKWVNSPSITGTDEVKVVEGEEIVEMKAVWVDSAGQAAPSRIPSPKRS